MIRFSAWRLVIAGALTLLLLATGLGAGAPASADAPRQESALEVSVSVSETAVSAFSGDRFAITSEIKNNSRQGTPELIANLAFVAIDGTTYVDPEDWSPQRTLAVGTIGGGDSAVQTWTIKPALEGDVAVYVVVLPREPELAAAGPLAASPAIHLHIEEERSLNPGGVLPVVLAVPGVLTLAYLGVRVSRRRR
jgi:hypothetical protein